MAAEEITGVILSGGKSSRLGEEKGLALFNGQPLIKFAIDALRPVSDKILISANHQLGDYAAFGYDIVEDQVKEIGPMGGLVACLKRSTTRYNFVLSCDTPFIDPGLFSHLLQSIENFQVAVPVHGNNLTEPLCAIYATNVIWHMQHCIEHRNYKLLHFLQEVNTKYIVVDDRLPFYHDDMFVNINTRKDILNNAVNG